MKSFSKDQIDTCRRTFASAEYRTGEVDIQDRLVDYFILPQKLFQMDKIPIPNGLFRMTGDRQSGYVIGVSTEVPNTIRPHFAFSEFNEFMVHGLDDPHRTIHSEQDMLGILNGKRFLRDLYVSSKLDLYNHMLTHSKGNLAKWRFTKEDYRGFEAARDFLKSK